jgi:glycosyltransferase involved in cell wall biosynthesis
MTDARAVFVTPVEPAMTGNGLAMRMGLFLSALSRFAIVDVIVVPVVAGQPGGSLIEAVGARRHVVPTQDFIDTRYSLLMRMRDPGMRLAAFQAYGRPSLSSGLSPSVLDSIAGIISDCKPDILHVGRSYLSEVVTLAPAGALATLDLDEDDLSNFTSQAALARRQGDGDRADWLVQEGRACDMMIERFGHMFRRVFVASDRDARLLSRRRPEMTFTRIENAIEIPSRPMRRDDGSTLLFVGALGYAPNSEGLLWFADQVLPRLKAMRAGVPRLLIAGAGARRDLLALSRHSRIRLLGRVEDLSRLYTQATLALAPMRSGGGTRIKLLEAAAYGVASVYTEAAAEGLEWPLDAGGWRAGDAREFATACLAGLESPAERRRRAMTAHHWIRRRHARDHIVCALAGTLKATLQRG